MVGAGDFVFDDGPLSHFAEAGWLGLLELVVGDANAFVPDVVEDEIRSGVMRHTHLQAVLDAPWLNAYRLDSLAETVAFSSYASRLVGADGERNLGECGVLALCSTSGATAVLDDGVARTIAVAEGITLITTVGLLCIAVREHGLNLDSASAVADALIRTEYRLPFEPGGFKQFVLENDLLPYEAP